MEFSWVSLFVDANMLVGTGEPDWFHPLRPQRRQSKWQQPLPGLFPTWNFFGNTGT